MEPFSWSTDSGHSFIRGFFIGALITQEPDAKTRITPDMIARLASSPKVTGAPAPATKQFIDMVVAIIEFDPLLELEQFEEDPNKAHWTVRAVEGQRGILHGA